MTKDELVALARQKATEHGLPPEVLCGLVERESQWNPWANRYEPGFMHEYVAPHFNSGEYTQTEAYGRAMSWGLMQIMGETARERGFAGQFFPQLCDPAVGLEYGCLELVHRLGKLNGDLAAALLAYNGGGNPGYPTEVLKLSESYKLSPPEVKQA